MAENDLKVIVKAKELAVHSFKLTSNCNRYGAWKNHISHGNSCKLGRATDERVRTIIGQAQGITRA